MNTVQEKDFLPLPALADVPEAGSVSWRSSSNIALIKYWGKRKGQLPQNPSLSLTLDHCATTTRLAFTKRKTASGDFSFHIFLDGKSNKSFEPKIRQFFTRIAPYISFLEQYHFDIHTSNSFPHSSGIASSASGMSALALCVMELERQLHTDMSLSHFRNKASFLARLGSGSACRSIGGPWVVWGEHSDIEGSTDLMGVSYPYETHEIFTGYRDTILLVDTGRKEVSSTLGHQLMHDHPFAEQRFTQARKNMGKLKRVFANGDLESFVEIVESEALSLHAMMMTSSPYFILMKPNTLEIIHRVWEFRKATDTPLCFTLDAGANVHVLYPKSEKDRAQKFIDTELAPFCDSGRLIHDKAGMGISRV